MQTTKTVPGCEVVTVTNLEEYRDNLPEILQLAREITRRWDNPPSDESVRLSLESAIRSATVFFILHRPDAQTMHIVGMAILSTIHAVGYTEGRISSFAILDNQPIGATAERRHLLTQALVDYARKALMSEISYQRFDGNLNKPDCDCFGFRGTHEIHSLDLVHDA